MDASRRKLDGQPRYEHLDGESVVSLHTRNFEICTLFDEMESHIANDFVDAVDEQTIKVIQIFGGFTTMCQLCDVGIMKPFKTELAQIC